MTILREAEAILRSRGVDVSVTVMPKESAGRPLEPQQLGMLDQERGQFDFPATIEAMYRLKDRNQGTVSTLVEEKANGAAAIATLKKDVPGVVAINPEGGKESRAAAAAPLFEAGSVWLPHPAQFPWMDGYLDEMGLFPRGSYDDQVDATTQALKRLQDRRVEEIDPKAFDMGFRSNPWI
jgi:predicted phage terminase large subunit-like protein